MGSAKTLNLLAVAHSYRQQGKRVMILKPALDTRFGASTVRSRAGLEAEADLLVAAGSRLDPTLLEGLSCILVDEAQFLAPDVVEHLRDIARDHGIPIICYGLRTDFRTRLFDGSRRLLELADAIEEIKGTCHFCNRKAIFNMRLVSGKPTLSGATVQLGAEESYLPACATCYSEKLSSVEDREAAKPLTAAPMRHADL